MDLTGELVAGIIGAFIAALIGVIWKIWIPNAVKNRFSKELAEYKRKQDEQLETHKRNLQISSERLKAHTSNQITALNQVRSLLRELHKKVMKFHFLGIVRMEFLKIVKKHYQPNSPLPAGWTISEELVWGTMLPKAVLFEPLDEDIETQRIKLCELIMDEIVPQHLALVVYLKSEGEFYLGREIYDTIESYMNLCHTMVNEVFLDTPSKFDEESLSTHLNAITVVYRKLHSDIGSIYKAESGQPDSQPEN